MECPSCGAHPALYWTGPCRCSREEQDEAYARLPPGPVIPGWEEAEKTEKTELEQEGIALSHEAAALVAADPNRFPG